MCYITHIHLARAVHPPVQIPLLALISMYEFAMDSLREGETWDGKEGRREYGGWHHMDCDMWPSFSWWASAYLFPASLLMTKPCPIPGGRLQPLNHGEFDWTRTYQVTTACLLRAPQRVVSSCQAPRKKAKNFSFIGQVSTLKGLTPHSPALTPPLFA